MTTTAKGVTPEMVEAACKGYWPDHWPKHFAEQDTASIRRHMRSALESALSVSSGGLAVKAPTHRHLKSGHLVRVVGTGRMQMSTVPAEDMDDVVIYEHDGNLWVRAHWEFHDGRFAALSALDRTTLPAAEGMVLVPKTPTPEMLAAWYRYKNGHHWHDEPPPRDTSDYGAYAAMLAAAPKGAL